MFSWLKVANKRFFLKWRSPKYKLCGINFTNKIPLLHVEDKACKDTFLLLTAMEIIAREDMITKFSSGDIRRICYCLGQEYYLLDMQQLREMKSTI